MEKALDVAQYIFLEYKKISGKVIDEMKLHKLLYLTQRESLAVTGEPMFAEEFEVGSMVLYAGRSGAAIRKTECLQTI